jgi:predicted extracellular nuclease
MLNRASFVPSPLILAVVAACQLTPENPATGDDSSGTATGTDATATGDTTADPTNDSPPTSSEPTTDGPTTQTTPSDTTDSGGDDVTIYDIQMESIPPDAVVTVKGVIVTSQIVLDDDGNGALFVEEPEGGPYSGIQLYLYDEVAAAWDAPVGSVVDLTGTYTEFYDNSQLTIKAVADFSVTGEADLPPPAPVASAAVATGSPDAEQWEGVVVRLTDAEVTNTTDVGPGKFQVDDAAIISDYFIYPENSFNAQVGQVYAAITGPLLYSFNEFQVCPRTLSDLSDGGDTDTTDTETTDPTDTDTSTGDDKVTIYDIQQGKFNLQDIVTVEGVVATSGLTFKKDGFFVQDPMGGEYSGIFVYINMQAIAVEAGDVLTITGAYDEFFNYSQIKVTNPADVVVTGTAPIPAPAVVAAADVATGGSLAENYEGVLIQVNDAKVTAAVNMFGEFKIEGDLLVDDLFIAKADWVNPMIGAVYSSITGPLAYSFDEFKLSPPKPADVKP